MPDDDKPLYTTAADALGMRQDGKAPTPGMSYTPGLREVADSRVPNASHSHVIGPQQAACDPVLAGLDTEYRPMTRAENRGITRIDGQLVAPPADAESDKLPGPTGASATAAEGAAELAAKATPSVVLPHAEPAAAEAQKPDQPALPQAEPAAVEGAKQDPDTPSTTEPESAQA